MPRRRQYVVTVSEPEAARLRAFDNKAHGIRHWPLGPNTTFMRRNQDTFVVKDWTAMGMGQGMVTTVGTATLRERGRIEVVVKTKGVWPGYLLIACGLACLAVIPRDGFWAAVLGLALILGGWFLFVRRGWAEGDLDKVEEVLRSEIDGEWAPATN